MSKLDELAQHNMRERFRDNPCRGIVIGMNGQGSVIQLSWIMGRSSNSQNRIYVVEDGKVKTKAFDESKVEDPSLIIYDAMRTVSDDDQVVHIVGNGDQVDTFARDYNEISLDAATVFYDAMRERYCEPDAPTFTARITGFTKSEDYNAYISVLKRDPYTRELWVGMAEQSDLTPEHFAATTPTRRDAVEEYNKAVGRDCELNHHIFPTVRETFEKPLVPGLGYCVTTYRSGSKDLPPFEGGPFVVPVRGEVDEVMQSFWEVLESQWKVALAGKSIAPNDEYRIARPINRHEIR